MKTKLNYNQDWSKYFQLDENSPSGLVRITNIFGKSTSVYPVGRQHSGKNGKVLAWKVDFKSKCYYIHRIIWVLAYGHISPDLVIDHLDGNPLNNKTENLSLKSQKDNTRNKCIRNNSKTGITGVLLVSNGQGCWYYSAHWSEINGKRNSKQFSINHLGEDTAKILAIAYRAQEIQRLITEGANYTERHGL